MARIKGMTLGRSRPLPAPAGTEREVENRSRPDGASALLHLVRHALGPGVRLTRRGELAEQLKRAQRERGRHEEC